MATEDYSQYPPPAPIPSLSITPWVAESALSELIVLMVFEFIALACVAMRVYCRIKKGGRFYLNDYAIFWAMVWASVLVFDSLASILQGGTGHHIQEIIALAPERLPTMAKLFLAAQFAWALANTGIKVSMIDLYIKIFGGSRRFRQVSYCLMALTLAYCLIVILNAFLICRPLAYNWNPAGHSDGKCGNQRAAFFASGMINLILDLCVICLPMPVLWRLSMPIHRKISLSFMFGIGYLICGITIWRMVHIQNLDFGDTFFKAGALGVTSCLEPLLGIANACFPVLQPVVSALAKPVSGVRSYLSRLVGSSRYSARAPSKESARSRNDSDRGKGGRTESKNFQRLYDHVFPMPSMERNGTTTTTSTTEDRQQHRGKSDEIVLTQEFEVSSHTAK